MLGLAGALWLAAPSAAAADKQACVAAYESAQELRRRGKLIEARAALVTCSQASCPPAATADCAPWLAEVEQSLPSVVIEARDPSGRELLDARVLVDGHPLAAAMEGKAVPVDPGVHTFRYEPRAGAAVEERITIREGEKNRKLTVVLGAAPGARSVESGPPRQASPGEPLTERPIPPLVWVLAGAGTAGIGVFAVVGAHSLSEESDLRSTCAPRCPGEDVSAIRTEHTVADIGLGVGVASLGAAAWLFFTRPAVETAPSTRSVSLGFMLQPSSDGAAASLGGTF